MITEPGTIDDMVADAAAAGYQVNQRLIRDWTQQGLLDYPQRRPAGKGHGSAAALYPASQRELLLMLLYQRPGKSISSLARVPVAIWMYWGEEHVPAHQALRALRRNLGDPKSRTYPRDATRSSRERARDIARILVRQFDSPLATDAARRGLLNVLTESAWSGRVDFAALERALTAVFDAGTTRIRRAAGHPSAPITSQALITSVRARLAAVTALTRGEVTHEMLTNARDAHLFGYAEYMAMRPALAASAPPGVPELYAPVAMEDTLADCCGHLLSALGLEILFPVQAELMRQARATMRRPTRAELGIIAPDPAATPPI